MNVDINNGLGSDLVVEHYSNGSRYEGEKLNGCRHGEGRFYY